MVSDLLVSGCRGGRPRGRAFVDQCFAASWQSTTSLRLPSCATQHEMRSFLWTTAFWVIFASSWAFIFITSGPLFAQILYFKDLKLRTWSFTLGGFPYVVLVCRPGVQRIQDTKALINSVDLQIVFTILCWGQRRFRLSSRMERIPRRDVVLKEGDVPPVSPQSNIIIRMPDTQSYRLYMT